MKKAIRVVAAITIALATTGCDWRDVAYGLAAFNGVVVVDARDRDYYDRGSCDEWYDVFDPGCRW